jgi:hypothetical protein
MALLLSVGYYLKCCGASVKAVQNILMHLVQQGCCFQPYEIASGRYLKNPKTQAHTNFNFEKLLKR